MKCIIIPCYNEGSYIETVIKNAEESSADKIIIVENGSEDDSFKIIKQNLSEKTSIIYVNTPLGHDIPKAAGLYFSLLDEGDYFIFYDGDMTGMEKEEIESIFESLKSGNDLVLTDCYYDGNLPSGLAAYVLYFRKLLNNELNIYNKIMHASPSHGPVGLSKKLATSIPIEYIGIPPLLLVYAAENNFKISIGLQKLHESLGSRERTEKHRLKMAETIVGDCIFALRKFKNDIPNRKHDGIEYSGFHSNRRFDLLKLITSKADLF